MRKAILLYNPLSGQGQQRRYQVIEGVQAILRQGGVVASSIPTQSALDTTEQARQAIAAGCDTVFACGGDGTIQDVLQALVGTDAALGIIPMGTANTLAHDLGLPLKTDNAARAALSAKPRRIAVGKIECLDLSGKPLVRYFTVTAGIGVDAHLFHKLDPTMKRRFGMASYYLKATMLWLAYRMNKFAVEYEDAGVKIRHDDVTQLLAVRIRNFGGVLKELAPGASLTRNDMRLVSFRTNSRLAYLSYVVRGMVGAKREVRGIELAYSADVTCNEVQASSRTFVEADGELLGTLPVKISTLQNAVTFLFPKN